MQVKQELVVAEGDGASALRGDFLKNLGERDLVCTWSHLSGFPGGGSSQGIVGHGRYTGISGWAVYEANENIYVIVGDATIALSDDTSFASAGITTSEWYDGRLSISQSAQTAVLNINGTDVLTLDISTLDLDLVFLNDFRLLSYGDTLNVSQLKSFGSIKDVELKYDDVTVAKYPLEGHVYDTSGNGYHLTNEGVDLTAVANDRTDGLYSSLLREGFDLYTDDATVLIDYYVPYMSPGVPVVSSVSGYTKQSERPALEKGCNNAPVKITFSNGLTGDIMDRSDTAIWNDLARTGVTYDSSNPRDWSTEDLTNYKLQLWSESAYLERNYMADIESGFVVNGSGKPVVDGSGYPTVASSDVVKFESLLLYDSVLTAEEAVKVAEYLLKRKHKEV